MGKLLRYHPEPFKMLYGTIPSMGRFRKALIYSFCLILSKIIPKTNQLKVI